MKRRKILLVMFLVMFGYLFCFENIEAKLICQYDEYRLVFNSGNSLKNTIVYKNNERLSNVYVGFKESKCPKKIYLTEIDALHITKEPYELVEYDDVKNLNDQQTKEPKLLTCKYSKYKIVFDTSDDSKESTIVYDENNDELDYVDEVYVDFKSNECPKKIYIMDLGFISITNVKPNIEDFDENILLKSFSNANKVSCGSGKGMVTGIPSKIPELTSFAITIIQIAVPIILVLMGSLDLFKGITAGKEDEMKKGQQMFIKRLVVGAIIFFVVVIVKFLISIIADTNETNIVDCIDCFVSNDCKEE